MIRDSKQLQIGKAGEYLVCADLIMKGFIAFPSEQGLPYDGIEIDKEYFDNSIKRIIIETRQLELF